MKANTKYISVKLPETVRKEIDDFRKENPYYSSRADVVRKALEYFLEKHHG